MPDFRITISSHRMPSLQFTDASEELHKFLRGVVMNNFMSSEDYKYSKGAGAFLQGGANETSGWILIEFWQPAGAQAFVDYVQRQWNSRE